MNLPAPFSHASRTLFLLPPVPPSMREGHAGRVRGAWDSRPPAKRSKPTKLQPKGDPDA